jgi:hypothetical protein
MKAVATALVLIAGAAVVLWYGNMLNSWVVGGLVGGLAALLLSIPLSLLLFSHFARHQDEGQKEGAFEEERYVDDGYHQIAARRVRSMRDVRGTREVYEVLEDRVPQRNSTWNPEEDYQVPPARRLSSPAQYRLPAAREYTTSQRLPAQERGMTSRHPTRQLPEYQVLKNNQKAVSTDRSQLQAKALRTARLEASQQSREQDFEQYSYKDYRAYGSERGSELYNERRSLEEEQLSTHEHEMLSQRRRMRAARRERRIVDSTLLPKDTNDGYEQYTLNSPSSTYGEVAEEMDPTDMQNSAVRERDTDRISTSPPTESVGRSLVRRAPYLYEDDPLRQELAQHVQEPITRRSTRYLVSPSDEEEQEW